MSPYQHGEVFVTKDGGETDLDLGHYERFIDVELTRDSNVTAGQTYLELITRERRGDFLGGTIQTVPHLTNEIKDRLISLAEKSNADVVVVEVGGTGEISRGSRSSRPSGRCATPWTQQRFLHASDPAPVHLGFRRIENQTNPAQA